MVSTDRPSSTETDARAAAGSAAPLRIVVAKPGMDGHDRGAKIIARAFRDAGWEVIYTGIFQTAESIARVVVDEDAQVLGISILSGSHLHYAEAIGANLKEMGADDVLVVMGGTIPGRDLPRLKELGVAQVFGPGTSTRAIVAFVRQWAIDRGWISA